VCRPASGPKWTLTAQTADEFAELLGVLLHDRSNDPNHTGNINQARI
jgi:hypothetical protein